MPASTRSPFQLGSCSLITWSPGAGLSAGPSASEVQAPRETTIPSQSQTSGNENGSIPALVAADLALGTFQLMGPTERVPNGEIASPSCLL